MDRLFPWMHRSKLPVASDYLFPPDDKYSPSPRMSFDHRQSIERPATHLDLTLDDSPHLLGKQTQPSLTRLRGLRNAGGTGYRKRQAVKFGAVNPDDLSSDDEDDPLSAPPPLARRTSTLSSVTLTNGSNAGFPSISSTKGNQEKVASAKRTALRGQDDGTAEYSDYEEDVTNAQTQTEYRTSPGWKPPFLARHGSNAANSVPSVGTVPMTPSLIRAVDRIKAAQVQAYSTSLGDFDSPATAPDGHMEGVSVGQHGWEAFWRDVTAKAAEGTGTNAQ